MLEKSDQKVYILNLMKSIDLTNKEQTDKDIKEILNKLDPSYSKSIVNFAKYKNLLFLSAKYLELDSIEKKKFSIEMLFNIYETDFKDKFINKEIIK